MHTLVDVLTVLELSKKFLSVWLRASANRFPGTSTGLLCLLLLLLLAPRLAFTDTVFLYSSVATIRGINLTQSSEQLLTTTPLSSSANGLAVNTDAGIVYYGGDTTIYRWDPALGSGASSHSLMNDFSSGAVQAPINNINSAGGSYLNGVYYVGSETAAGYIEEIYAVSVSTDGLQVLSAAPVNLLTACNCTGVQLGGFGDIAAVLENGSTVIYGSSADISGNGSGTVAGYWKLDVASGTWTLLNTGAGGQLSNSLDNRLYSNSGTGIREVNKSTGALGPVLINAQAAIWDFSGGMSFDFGDAAASYGAAMHRLPAQQPGSIYLGATAPDNEAGALNAQAGLLDNRGDDNSGIDDEDAVNLLDPINQDDDNYSMTFSCISGNAVAGWIDLNGNGQFDNSERNDSHPRICSAGNVTLNWTSISATASGTTSVRLRTSSQAAAIATATGLAPDGEAEDHQLTILTPAAGSCAAGDILTTYSATDLPLIIASNAVTQVTSTISVSDAGNVTDVNLLDVQGSHTYINDLQFTLTHNSTSAILYGPACGSQNNFNMGFDDEAVGTAPCPPIDGNLYPPAESLDAFDGGALAGDWELTVSDSFPLDGGSLENWTLQVCSTPPFIEDPQVRLGKSMSVDDQGVVVTLAAENTGNVELSDVQITDDLDLVFGSGNYMILQAPELLYAPAGVSLDGSFSGSAGNQSLLAPGTNLATGETLALQFSVELINQPSGPVSGQISNQASINGESPAGTIASDLSGNGLDLTLDNDDPTTVLIDTRRTLQGRVFLDTSGNIASSHDGIFQAAESGVAGMQIEVYLVSSGQIIANAYTAGDGRWQLPIDSSYDSEALGVRLVPDAGYLVISESSIYSGAGVSDGTLLITTTDGSSSVGLDIGVLKKPLLTHSQTLTVPAGSVFKLPHSYTASSYGELLLELDLISLPDSPEANVSLVHDLDCNQMIGPTETSIVLPVQVVPDQLLCLIVDGFIPSSSPQSQKHTVQLNSTLTYSDINNTSVNVQSEVSNTDSIRVTAGTDARLALHKSVSNVTLGGGESIANTALPGHVLEYRIRFVNQGTLPIDDLTINDAPPAFTQILSGSVACVEVPLATSCAPLNTGTDIQWQLTGSLPAGAQGTVSYQVLID